MAPLFRASAVRPISWRLAGSRIGRRETSRFSTSLTFGGSHDRAAESVTKVGQALLGPDVDRLDEKLLHGQKLRLQRQRTHMVVAMGVVTPGLPPNAFYTCYGKTSASSNVLPKSHRRAPATKPLRRFNFSGANAGEETGGEDHPFSRAGSFLAGVQLFLTCNRLRWHSCHYQTDISKAFTLKTVEELT